MSGNGPLRGAPLASDSPSPHWRWLRWVLLAIIAVIVAMWVYIFGFAPRTGAYRVRDDAWRTKAQAICTEARERRTALADTTAGRIPNPTPEQVAQHAGLVDQATGILAEMLDQIDALPITSERDQLTVDTFLRYYRMIIDDRQRYTARLRAGELRPYEETVVGGGPVTNVVTDFTSGNGIKACVPPGELGQDAGN